MRTIFFIAVLTVFIVTWSLDGESGLTEKTSTELRVISADVSSSGMNVGYKLRNQGKRAVFIIVPDPDASLDNWPKVPFVRFEESDGTLEVSSYIAPLPTDRLIESPYYHPVIKLNPGESTRRFSLRMPVYTNAPYAMTKTEVLDLNKVQTIRLRLAYIPCDQVATVMQRVDGKSQFKYVAGTSVIDCDGRKDSLFQLQSYAEDKKVVSR